MSTGTQATAVTRLTARPGRWPSPAAAAITALGVAGFTLFLASLPGIALDRMTGLGLVSVLPASALAGVTMLALALVAGLFLPRAHPAGLAAALAGLVICLDGVTAFTGSAPRFPTSYQIAGFVQYLSATGHVAPGLAAYFSWPGFFALISLVTGAAGTHSLLGLMRVWPVVIDLLCLPPFFLMMAGLRISWRARWAAGLLFAVGNWVGQDYFSPQSLNYLLYLVFLAILVNWFTGPRRAGGSGPDRAGESGPDRPDGRLRPGERGPRPAGTGQRAFLLGLLLGIFTLSTMSHQLTPFYMIGACVALLAVRRSTLRSLPVLLGVILVGWISFAAVDYWSGHMSNIFGGVGNLGSNLTSSVGGRLAGSTGSHLLALHMREVVAATIVGLALAGLVRRRRHGFDDRILMALLAMPVASIGLQSYGGEMALRIYLFLLPAACVAAGSLFFTGSQAARPTWRAGLVLALCATLLPTAFLAARYGNEAFEQVPSGELAASNWIYAHDGAGARILWPSASPAVDVTPEMPWSYRDIGRVAYRPVQAPQDPASVSGAVAALRQAGPGSYLILTGTQAAYLEQSAGYPAGWGGRFSERLGATPGVRVVFAARTATVYALRWPAGARPRPLPAATGGAARTTAATSAGLALLALLIAVLTAREFDLLARPAGSRLSRALTVAAVPLLVATAGDVILRFMGVT
jgi:hypothetical protein